MASIGRIGAARDGAQPKRYVASLLWSAHLPSAANDNRGHLKAGRLFSLCASAALLAAAVWAVVS